MKLMIEIQEIDYRKTATTWLSPVQKNGGLKGVLSEKILLGIEKLPQRKKEAVAVWFLNQMEEKLLSIVTEEAAKQGVYLKVTALKAECDHPAKEKTETS